MPPCLDHLMDSVMAMAKEERFCQVQVQNFPQGENPAQLHLIGKNWITRFLNHHPDLAWKFASRIDRQRAYASNPYTVKDHYRKFWQGYTRGRYCSNEYYKCWWKGICHGNIPTNQVCDTQGAKEPSGKARWNTGIYHSTGSSISWWLCISFLPYCKGSCTMLQLVQECTWRR